MSSGDLHTPTGSVFDITHNSANWVYTATSGVSVIPVGQTSHVVFGDTAFSTSSGGWVAADNALMMRNSTGAVLDTGDVFYVYTTPRQANLLKYKRATHVFTLADSNITIRFV